MQFISQHDQMDCGPACLAMISSHHGKKYSLEYLKKNSFVTKEGVSLLGIKTAASMIGLDGTAAELSVEDFSNDMLPCILHWNQNHFVVLYKIYNKPLSQRKSYKIADPGHGKISLSEEQFLESWYSKKERGIALFLETTEDFYLKDPEAELDNSVWNLLHYLKPFKKQMIALFVLLLLGTLTTLVFPILTQKLIDEGVQKKSMQVVSYILMAQLAFFSGNIVFDIFRNWITISVGAKVNIEIISQFLGKLMKLPMKFFDTKFMGDFNQRIIDHERIEQFLTSQSLMTFFSIIMFSVYFGILWYYDFAILLSYIILTILSVLWSIFWLNKRKQLDYIRFQSKSQTHEEVFQIIHGITEMKLNQYEELKRRDWEHAQQKLYKINLRILRLDEIQASGFNFINQFKNIMVTFMAASYVISGRMSLGELLGVSYIIGQINGPVNQLIVFFRSLQNAKLSLARLDEIHRIEDEDHAMEHEKVTASWEGSPRTGIQLKGVSFQYEGPASSYVLRDLNLHIPHGKITAIVGASGSGKTTLMKLLLKFYSPTDGALYFNDVDMERISSKDMRKLCGVVMQDGFIFSETLERNIATGEELIDEKKFDMAVKISNIETFIAGLSQGVKTKIGAAGNALSGGQKQRVLIARAIYKDPDFIFLDEATSALDSKNEKVIHDNLQLFLKNKTGVIIAHRLSTVKQADQIVVLKNGRIVEVGSHQELAAKKGEYFDLVRNQLELGN
ncbi:peptidase domain-containing ABC transporter [Sphingobacterium sp. WOUb80]|uniref:peptidase domain-containing ABC transporter n=1 Tax=Sphingobacterium sp. WOUb80 TaxID=3234028 RepID=UPI003CFA141A